MKHLFEVIEHAGGHQALADAVNQLLPATARKLTRQTVRHWTTRDMDVPAEYCMPIAHLYPIALASLNPHVRFDLAPMVLS